MNRRKILVVDDDKMTRELIRKHLGASEFSVEAAEDGFGGIQEALGGSYELILLDLTMPRVNGLRVLKTLRKNEKTQDTPIIIVTGNNNIEEMRAVEREGISGYLVKPVRRAELLTLVRKALGMSTKEVAPEGWEDVKSFQFGIRFEIVDLTESQIVLRSPVHIPVLELAAHLEIPILTEFKIRARELIPINFSQPVKQGEHYIYSFSFPQQQLEQRRALVAHFKKAI